MSATVPEEVHHLWVDRVNRGDLDGLVALYEPAAAFVVQPGQVVARRDAVREASSGLLALIPAGTLEVWSVIAARDVALLISTWSLTGAEPDGNTVTLAGQTSDVALRQDDGSWCFAIDNPWGDAAARREP